MRNKIKKKKHWIDTYEDFGQIIYEVDADVYQNKKLTKEEINIVLNLLKKFKNLDFNKNRDKILDLACGPGRHSITLAKRSFSVIGLDYSRSFLEIAKKNAKKENIISKIKFIQGDLRNLPFRDFTFKIVLLLGNSFGYFSHKENIRILKEVYRVLKPNGVFIFDLTDKKNFLKNLKPYSRYEVLTKSFGLVIDERWRKWNPRENRIYARKRHTTIDGRVLLDTPYCIRLYDKIEVKEVLQKIGFRKIIFNHKKDKANMGLMQHRIFIACQK